MEGFLERNTLLRVVLDAIPLPVFVVERARGADGPAPRRRPAVRGRGSAAACKMIRNDRDYGEQVELYLGRHREITFTHGMCPECLARYSPTVSVDPVTPA